MRVLLRLLLVALVVGGVGGGVFLIQQRKAAQMQALSQQVFPPAAVSVAEVATEQWRQTLFAVGTLAAEQGVDVTAPLAGTVVAIHFDSGEDVSRGQKLLTQDIGIQAAELEGLEARLDLRTTQYERAKRLLAKKQVSQSDYDAARAALDEATADVAAQRALIVRKTVYAPFDGQLGIRQIGLGTYLEPGDPIVPLQMLDPIHVDYAVPEQSLSRVASGQAVEVKVPAWPEELFKGRITAFDPGVDPATRNVRIRATIDNPDHRLRPGMFAEVWTVESEPRTVRSLPVTAVTYSPFGDTLFVVLDGEAGATVERRQVRTGEQRDGRVEIVEGVVAGDRVVAVGQNKLRNGMAVTVVDEIDAALAVGAR